MRTLQQATNVDAPDSDYPKGKVRDRSGAVPGTIYNEALHGDLITTIQKIVSLAGTVENTNPDNETNGYQLLQALQKIIAPGIYVGDIVQNGTANPVLTQRYNTTTFTPSVTRISSGVYETNIGANGSNVAFFTGTPQNVAVTDSNQYLESLSGSPYGFNTLVGTTFTDSILRGTLIIIQLRSV